ncbi:hypothetical protein ES703_22996 [subsurface metagenome]
MGLTGVVSTGKTGERFACTWARKCPRVCNTYLMGGIRGRDTKAIPGLDLRREVVRMSKHQVRDKGLKVKRAELREVNKAIIEVEKSIEELRGNHEELVNRRFGIKTEIILLGGKVPKSQDHEGLAMLWHLRDGRKLSDLRP